MYNFRPRSPSPVRRSASPSRYPAQGMAQGNQFSPMMCCMFILIIFIILLIAGIVVIGVFLALSNPECEPAADCPIAPTCPLPSTCPDPVEPGLVLTPAQVAQHQANFDQLRADIADAEGFYDPAFLHKREYYTRDLLPPLTAEQRLVFQQNPGCTDGDTFRHINELSQQDVNGQWIKGVPDFVQDSTSTVPGGRKKRASSSQRSCSAIPPAVLYTCIVTGNGGSGSLIQLINNYIQWVFHEDCSNPYSLCSVGAGTCCEIVRTFQAYVILVGTSNAIWKDIEVHTCDCTA